ncbi:MAG: PEGA domain-containing protein [Phycisphaerae bacterium]
MNHGGRIACGAAACIAVAAIMSLTGGCVERIAKIETQPPGAIVVINDEEVGVSPVTFSFLWYGDYDIVVRKEGYETLKTHHRIEAPWYQYPPIDFVVETLIPATLRDQRTLPTLRLTPLERPSNEALVERADELRQRALYQGGP